MKRKLWIMLALAALMAALCCGAAMAEVTTGICGNNVTWSFDSATGVATVTGTGPMWNYAYDDSSNHSPFEADQRVTSAVIGEGVTSIGKWFFDDCHNLTGVSLPSTLKRIEEGAFYDNDLAALTIPEGVVYIGMFAFTENRSFTELTLPNSVTELGNAPFSLCTGLTTAVLSEGMTFIPHAIFSNCSALTDVTIPAGVTEITFDAFNDCPSLSTIHGEPRSYAETYAAEKGYAFVSTLITTASGTCGAGVNWTLYDNGALEISGEGSMDDFSHGTQPWSAHMSDIRKVTVIPGVTHIGGSAFDGAGSLAAVSLPDGLAAVGGCAFRGTALNSVSIPESVSSIGGQAFADCTGLTDAMIRSFTAVIGDNAFDNCASALIIHAYGDSPAEAYADSNGIVFDNLLGGKCGDSVTWRLGYATGILTISGTGMMDDYTFNDQPWNAYMADVTTVLIETGVTGIGSSAFEDCAGMTGATIADSVTIIGSSAFEHCTGLNGVTIPDSVTIIGGEAFFGCTGLNGITIPDSVTSICSYAFRDCTGLTSITIPDSVASIGFQAFWCCSNLASVTILNPDAVIEHDVFADCSSSLVIRGYSGSTAETYANAEGHPFEPLPGGSCGDGVTWGLVDDTLIISGTGAMTDYAGSAAVPWVSYRNLIKSVVIKDGVTSVGKYSFNSFPALENVSLSDSVAGIGDRAFYRCQTLQGITLPDSVLTIGAYAFDSCTAMTAVHLGSGVTSLGIYAFYDCASVTAFTVNENNTQYSAEDGVLFNKTKTTLLCYPNGKTEPSYTLPDSVLMVSQIAFLNNKTLETVCLNSCLKTIQSFAFIRCTALQSIMIPSSVTNINQNCFEDCTALTSVTIMNPTMTFGADNIFNRCTALTLYGFAGSTAETYAAANGIPFLPLGGSCGDSLTWLFEDDTLTISGTGVMDDYTGGNQPWNVYLPDVTSVVVETGVTGIGNYAFEGAVILDSVSLPVDLTAIGDMAFSGCGSLAEITLPDSLTGLGDNTFSGCSALNAVTIPGGVQNIGVSAFEGCSALSGVTIQSGVASIGDYAFENCLSLTDVTLPESTASVGYAAFFGDTGLLSVTILNRTALIDDTAFYNCSSLTLRGYPGSSAEAFAALKNIPFDPVCPEPTFFLPAALTVLEDEAFCGIAAEAVFIPAGVTSIEGNPFSGSAVTHIYGLPGTAAETFASSHAEYNFVPVTAE